MANSNRLFVILLQEICASLGIQIRAYHGDWILTLKKGPKTEHIFGYDFSLNSAAAQQIAKDKAATYSILTTAKVPAVEHKLLMSPMLPDYMPKGGNWGQLNRLFKQWNSDVVCKPNDGTGGRDVFRARDMIQLERAIHTLLSKTRACAVSPYIDVQDEFRVVILDGSNLLTYRKRRPSVIGDGRSKLLDLLADWLKESTPSDLPPDPSSKHWENWNWTPSN